MAADPVVIVGAGIAGLVAAVDLAAQGLPVTVIERALGAGGKLRELNVGGAQIDAGPTVLTLKPVFDSIFATAGTTLEEHLVLTPATLLARHAWDASSRLDLYADSARTADAIGAFAGPGEARGYLDFVARAARIYRMLERPFLGSAAPSILGLGRAAGVQGLGALFGLAPFTTLWRALGQHFRDPRLQQLFGRYATYCGSSPFAAPATLMLVAHVEQRGVWLVGGGMRRLALALESLARSHGVTFRYRTQATELTVTRGRVAGVVLSSGERVTASAVILNADLGALAGGLFGRALAARLRPLPPRERSLSAMTFAVLGAARGFPLVHHNVFFSGDYRREFAELARSELPSAPTVYVCAQDRDATGGGPEAGTERLFCIVNAPACGDRRQFTRGETEQCEARMRAGLRRCGLELEAAPEGIHATTPTDFNRLFPGSGGALYGAASAGWRSAFRRPGVRGPIAGLYLASGSIHPGPGLPMAALSGRLAAASLCEDRASTPRSLQVAMSGGTSTR